MYLCTDLLQLQIAGLADVDVRREVFGDQAENLMLGFLRDRVREDDLVDAEQLYESRGRN